MFGRKRSGVQIKSFKSAGAYQHEVRFWRDILALFLKRLLICFKESMKDYMKYPQGSDKLVSRIEYRHTIVKDINL